MVKLFKLRFQLITATKVNLIVILATGYHKYDILQAAIDYFQLSDSIASGALYGPEGKGGCDHFHNYDHLSCVLLQFCRRSGAGIPRTEVSDREPDHPCIYMDRAGGRYFLYSIQAV